MVTWARYLPIPWIRRQHKVGLRVPEVDDVIEPLCRAQLTIWGLVLVFVIVWSPVFVVYAIFFMALRIVEWLEVNFFDAVMTATGGAAFNRLIDRVRDRKAALIRQGRGHMGKRV